MAIITLLTDFGEKDGYVGAMKGVILSIAPEVKLVDLSHELEPRNVLAGAMLLGRSLPFFPSGSIYLAVVDPGVGTERRPIAARLGEQYFVGPDNGLMTLMYTFTLQKKQTIEIIHLNQAQYWLPVISQSFHGRDIFAPVAAHLSIGVKLAELGVSINDPVLLQIPEPVKTEEGWRGQIMHIDTFGNLATNLTQKEIGSSVNVQVKYKGRKIQKMVRTYGGGRPGELIAMLNSSGYLAICLVNGNAAVKLHAQIGDKVSIQEN